MLSIFKKSQKRNKKASGSEQTVRLVLIIRWAIVAVVLGLYGGLELSHQQYIVSLNHIHTIRWSEPRTSSTEERRERH
jgi:formate-dependent nitrite reductase membrane component NrfD